MTTAFSNTIASLSPHDGDWLVNPGDDWRQGRTLFGGLSAALCLAACERAAPGLPPLRAAQIAFIAPSAGEARLRPVVLRQGKSVTFMACDLIAEGAVAVRALFAFGASRPSAYSADAPSAPVVPPPDQCGPLFPAGQGPTFAAHIDQRFACGNRPYSGAGNGDLTIWVRHRDAGIVSPMASLLALGDAMPPASMTRFAAHAAISTMTWGVDLFAPERERPSAWVLLRSCDDGVGHGYAGQAMAMWDENGVPILHARQSVAIFG